MKKINLIIPMAGGGTRFKEEGILQPKPLITLNKKPFFFWATQSILKFMDVETLIFVILKEHVEKYQIDKEIYKYYPKAKLYIIDEVLNGAVLTCLEGIKLINNTNPILFNDCDHAFICDSFYQYCLKERFDIDGALLTFKSKDPKYSYIDLDKENNVIKTMEKKVISNNAICGAYYFKNKETFTKISDIYLKNCNYKEYFISGLYNIMVDNNMIIKHFLTDYHISFGTPEEYKIAQMSDFKNFM